MRANRRATSVVGTSLRWALPLLLVLLAGGTPARAEDAPDTSKLTPVPAPPAKPYKADFPADLPFDPAAGEVLFLPSAAALRKMPAHTMRVRLVAVDEAGERPLGEYTFAHTPG